MNSKTDKESRSCNDIAFLSEIMANSMYWQAQHLSRGKFYSDCHVISTFSNFELISINHHLPLLSIMID